MAKGHRYDLLILGGGPAGITAALYGVRAGLSVVLFENRAVGGEIVGTERLDNFPAFPEGISGVDFGLLLERQMDIMEVPIHFAQIEKASLEGEVKTVVTTAGEFSGKTALIATGTEPNLLGVAGETELRGRGVSYCATCDGAFFRNKPVAVVGGGDAALEETIFLSRFAEKIYLLHRRDQFRGCSWLQNKVMKLPQVEVLWNTVVSRIEGDKKVSGLLIRQDGRERPLQVDAIFIYAGRRPQLSYLEGKGVEVDDNGFIITSEKMETSLPGVYAAGDIRRKFLRQVITAASDGAIAAMAASQHIFS